jgi:hypothetical protein
MLPWLVFFVQWSVLGILIAAWGAYLLRRREVTKRKLYARWGKLLHMWNISLTEDELSQAIPDIQKSWNALMSWGMIGLGVAMILVGLLNIPQLLLTSDPQISHPVLI